MIYVKDTAPMAWGPKDNETYLWHLASFVHGGVKAHELKDVSWVETSCGHRIQEPTEFIDHDMSFADWDREYGTNVDLCSCAVYGKDAERVAELIQENTDGTE